MHARRSLGSWIRRGATQYPNGLFGIEGLVRPTDFSRISKQRVNEARSTMEAWRLATGERKASEEIVILDNVSNSLCRIADAAEFIRNVDGDATWITHATEAVQEVSGFMNEANVSSELYLKAKAILNQTHGDLAINKEYQHVISSMVQAMEHEGVNLSPQAKVKLVDLQEQDVMKSFSIVQTREDDVSGIGRWIQIPESSGVSNWFTLLKKRTNNFGKTEVLIPAGNLALLPHLLKSISCRSTRQSVWESVNEATDAMRMKEEAMLDLVRIRREIAQIRGYTNWNEYAQRESILSPIGGPKAVEQFLADLWTDIGPGLSKELNVLSTFIGGNSLEPWDLDFCIESWKSSNDQALVSTRAIQSKLTFQRLLAGAQKVLGRVLGVDLQHDRSAGKLWHQDAFRLSLSRGGQPPFAQLYIDPYARETKSVHSAQFTLAGSKRLFDGTKQLPQTALVLALPSDPTLALPVSVAQTFFHELGHAVHSLLSETELQHFSGSRGAIDFVEFPSHLFEYFATEPACLEEILGSEVHASYFDDFAKNRNPFAHIEVAQQLTYAMLDQVIYATGSADGLGQHLPELQQVDRARILNLLQPRSTANFEHLVHYGGSYYCYLLCRCVAAEVWDKSFRRDPWSRESGRRLETFLRNGSVDQSLVAIESIMPPESRSSAFSRDALLLDLKRCASVHS